MNKQEALKVLGSECRNARRKHLRSQAYIATMHAGCSVENISKFERGQNCNVMLLMAYKPYIEDMGALMNKVWEVYNRDT